MEETIEYPPKPEWEIEPQKTNWGKTVFSLLLFFFVFNFFFGWEVPLVIALIAVITIHELGHFLAMKFFGYQNVSLMFIPLLGAYTAGQKEDVPYSQELITLFAGPVPGIVAGMILLPFVNIEEPGLFGNICFMLLGLNLFNMLPIIPLDGGRIFDKLFTRLRFWIRIFLMGGALVGILIYEIFQLIAGDPDIFMALLGFFIVQNLVNTFKMQKSQREMRAQGLDPDKSYGELTDAEYWKMSNFVKDRIKALPNENIVMMQVRALLNHSSISRLNDAEKVLFFGAWLFFFVAPFVEFILLNLKMPL